MPSKTLDGLSAVESAVLSLCAKLKRTDRRFTNFAGLRAPVITHWIKTVGLRKAQYFAGHKSIVSAEDYLPDRIEDLARDMTRFNPF